VWVNQPAGKDLHPIEKNVLLFFFMLAGPSRLFPPNSLSVLNFFPTAPTPPNPPPRRSNRPFGPRFFQKVPPPSPHQHWFQGASAFISPLDFFPPPVVVVSFFFFSLKTTFCFFLTPAFFFGVAGFVGFLGFGVDLFWLSPGWMGPWRGCIGDWVGQF